MAAPANVDKATRLEILTRLRDHAPKEFFVVYAKNTQAVSLLREWGKNAVKKKEFEETLTCWLQVSVSVQFQLLIDVNMSARLSIAYL